VSDSGSAWGTYVDGLEDGGMMVEAGGVGAQQEVDVHWNERQA
jgi:hypothetical protein